MRKIRNNMLDIKKENINTIFELIKSYDDISRVRLSELSDLTKMSITRIVTLLMENNLVYEKGEVPNGRGRPAKELYINKKAIYTLSIHLDVEDVKMAIIDLKNNFIYEKSLNARNLNTMEEYVDKVYEDCKNIPKDLFEKIKIVSFICPGIINPNNGEVALSVQLKWKHEKLGEYGTEIFGKKVIVMNDVKAALKGEIANLVKRENLNLAYMDVGYGVGAGVINDGKVIYGANNNAGEIGHITINQEGKLCECGRRGCLNTVLSLGSILENAQLHDGEINKISDILDRHREGAIWTKNFIEDISTYLSIALNNIIYAYDPKEIILGGRFFEEFNSVIDIIFNSRKFIMNKHYWSDVKIRISTEKNSTHLLGGAISAQKLSINEIIESINR